MTSPQCEGRSGFAVSVVPPARRRTSGSTPTSIAVPVELGGLVVLARAALDGLFLVEQLLELGVGLVHERGGLALLALRALLGGRHDLAGLAGGLAGGHRRLLGDL